MPERLLTRTLFGSGQAGQKDLARAAALVLLILCWDAFQHLRHTPGALLIYFGVCLMFAIVAAMGLVAGGVGWIIVRIVRTIALWRARDELREGMTKNQILWAWVVVIFFGLPELAETIT